MDQIFKISEPQNGSYAPIAEAPQTEMKKLGQASGRALSENVDLGSRCQESAASEAAEKSAAVWCLPYIQSVSAEVS